MTSTVLILGANGRFGRNAKTAFTSAGWEVRCFDRNQDKLWDAAWGVDVIVNAWNPVPWTWKDTTMGLTAQVIEVAKASGATVLIPGNVYTFGADMPHVLGDATPQRPTTSYGKIRKEMEAAYREAGVKTVILRAGDFIDTEASGNWFDKIIMAKTGKGRVTSLGPTDIPHAWAFLPDMARAAVMLMERRDTLAAFEDIPFPGHTLSFEDIKAGAEAALEQKLKLVPMPWWPLRAMALGSSMMRYLTAMRYLWERPHALDGAKLQSLLPDFEPTPRDEMLRAAMAWLQSPSPASDRRVLQTL